MAWKKGIASHKTLASKLATAITTALDEKGSPMWELVPSVVGEFSRLDLFEGDGYVMKSTNPDFGEPLYLTIKPTFSTKSTTVDNGYVCEFVASREFTPGEDGAVGTHKYMIDLIPKVFKKPLSTSDILASEYYELDIFTYDVRVLKDSITVVISNNNKLFRRAEPIPVVIYFGKLVPLDDAPYSSYVLLSTASGGNGTSAGAPQVFNGHNLYEIASAKASDLQFDYDATYSGQMLATDITYGCAGLSLGKPEELYIIRLQSSVVSRYPDMCYQTIDGVKYLVAKVVSNIHSACAFEFSPHTSTTYLMLVKGAE